MKKVFLYVSIGIIFLSIPITVFLVGRSQEIRKRAAPATTISLSPAAITKRVGETFTLEVKLDTAGNQVMTVQLTILYDPALLKTEDITNGPMAPSIRVSGKANANGSASITVGARDNASPITGVGTIATITMRTIAASASPISIKFSPHPDTYANALNETNNVIIGTTGSNIIILNADGTQATANLAGNTTTATQSGTTTQIMSSPTPTPTGILEATGSAQASPSALLIEAPADNENVTTTTPEIHGKGTPGSTITIVIHSDPVTDTVTVDANGNWIYTPTTPLSPGTHTVEAMYTDPATGQTQTQTLTFVVEGETITSDVSSGSAIPVSGSINSTIFLITLSMLFLFSGALLPILIR